MGAATCGCSCREADGARKDRSLVDASRTEVSAVVEALRREEGDPRHSGQTRANLQVKSGGFAVSNFANSNAGKVEDFYLLERWVGEGGYGTVRKARHKQTKVSKAIKSILKNSSSPERIKEEMEIMRLVDHPHIVRVMETFADLHNIYLVMELCEGGELFDRVVEASGLTEQQASICVRQMLLAVNYLHHNQIMHRDLKPQNWLLATEEDVGIAPLKLIDFGLSRRYAAGEVMHTKVGTPSYVAPEVIGGNYNEVADIWSLGVVAYAVLSGELPFGGASASGVLREILDCQLKTDGGVWNKVSPLGKEMVHILLQKEPAQRPSASEALRHKWVAEGTCGRVDNRLPSVTLTQVGSLKAFATMNKVKKAAIAAMATQLTDKQIGNLKSQFMAMDSNQDGTVSMIELRQGLMTGGVAIPGDLAAMIEAADTDGSGAIDYTEFLAATLDKKHKMEDSVCWNAFKKFDLDGSDCISLQELRQVLGDQDVKEAMHLDGGERIDAILNEIDTNGDGNIDFQEFMRMVRADA